MTTREMTEGIQSGREAAFDCFYQSYADRMYRYLLVSLKGDEHLSQDVLQETLLRVIRYTKPLSDDAEMWRFLIVLMRSALNDHFRRGRSRASLQEQMKSRAQALVMSEEETNDALHAALSHALDELPEDDRALVEARYYQQRSLPQISEECSSTVKALGMKLVRVRRTIRDMIVRGLKSE